MDNTPNAAYRDSLTQREQEILRLIASGLNDREISEQAFLTVGTVKWYNRQIYSKLHVSNRTAAVNRARQLGLLDTPSDEDVPAPTMPAHNLPSPVASFVGRRQEIKQVQQLMQAARLITLTGPPGSGKTRLALEVAAVEVPAYRDGVYFVPLAPVFEPALVTQQVCLLLGLREAAHEPLTDSLKRHLKDKHLLLVLDNFEHLLAAAPLVTDLLAGAPRLTILVTSREMLHLYGEQEYPVPPLQLPDLKQAGSLADVQSNEAVNLFVQRASASVPNFTLDENNAAAIASICVQLDGLPLAIELAAARIKFYPPQNLLLRLGSRLDILDDGPRDLPSRQRTLRSTLAWSYDLLAEDEKTVFARLSIFAGGCDLDGAEAICGKDRSLNIARGLESLVNKNLVHRSQSASHEPRFGLLETMREYAVERLAERGETDSMSELHATHFLNLAQQYAGHLPYGTHSTQEIQRLEAELDNFRGALRWNLRRSNAGECLRLAASLCAFWKVRGYLTEGRGWCMQVLALEGAGNFPKERAEVLLGMGTIAYVQSDYELTEKLYGEALTLYRQMGNQVKVAYVLTALGEVKTEIGNYDDALRLMEQAYAEVGSADLPTIAYVRSQLGWTALRNGNYTQAIEWLEEGLALYQQTDDLLSVALTFSGLGEVALRQNNLDKATILLEKSLKLRREYDHTWGIAASLGSLAWVAMRQGQYDQALRCLNESLSIRQNIGDMGGIAWCLEKRGEVARIQEDPARAVRLLAAAARIRASVNSIVDPSDQNAYDTLIEGLRTELTPTIFDAVWAEGHDMHLEQLNAYAFPA